MQSCVCTQSYLKRIFAGVVFLLVGVPFGSASNTIPRGLEPLAQPTIGSSVVVLGNSFSWGHMTIVVNSGSIAPVMAGEQLLGLYFKGDGTFLYDMGNKLEHDIAAYNLDQISKQKITHEGGASYIQSNFKSMLILSGTQILSKPQGEGGEPLTNDFDDHLERFGRNTDTPTFHLLARHMLNGEKMPYVRVEIETGDEMLVYTHDMGHGKEETLELLRPPRNRSSAMGKNLYPALLSHQTIGRDFKKFHVAPFVLTHLNYKLKAKGENLKLQVQETIVPQGRDQRVFLFNLPSELFDDGKLVPYETKAVVDSKGSPCIFHHDNDTLMVILSQPAPANVPVTINFALEGNILIRPNGDNFWELGTWEWYPKPSHSGSYFTVEGEINVEKPFTVFAPGKTISRTQTETGETLVHRLEKPTQYTIVHGGKYAVHTEERDGITIRVCSYGMTKERPMERLGNLAASMIKYYEPWLGPFPYSEFNIIEVNRLGYGQAPPGTMFITREAFEPGKDVNRLFTSDINQRFAHEIAHQYWGHAIKWGERHDQWLSEAFAEYSSSIVIQHMQGEERYQKVVKEWHRRGEKGSEVGSVAFANRLLGKNPSDNRMNRIFLLYEKGAYLLYALHQDVGDETFFKFLRVFQDIYAYKIVTTEEVIHLLNKLTGKDYNAFFDKYYWGMEMPPLELAANEE